MSKSLTEPKTSEVRDVLTKVIIEKGFPVIASFDWADSCALIYAKSETDIYVGDAYGEDFLEPKAKSPYSLKDIDEEGLFHLYHDGVRPGEDDWNNLLDYAKDDQADQEGDDDGDDGE
jgi:hypothetical protein